MTTNRQDLGAKGEALVAAKCGCPKCKRPRTFKRLPASFKCADLICDFCGYLTQVKAATSSDVQRPPSRVIGAAWSPQKERMDSGIYFPLFLVLVSARQTAIYYLSADLQRPEMFIERKPLGPNARRAGWTGFYYDFKKIVGASLVRLA